MVGQPRGCASIPELHQTLDFARSQAASESACHPSVPGTNCLAPSGDATGRTNISTPNPVSRSLCIDLISPQWALPYYSGYSSIYNETR